MAVRAYYRFGQIALMMPIAASLILSTVVALIVLAFFGFDPAALTAAVVVSSLFAIGVAWWVSRPDRDSK